MSSTSQESDDEKQPNFQSARQLFENSTLHYYGKKGGTSFGCSVSTLQKNTWRKSTCPSNVDEDSNGNSGTVPSTSVTISKSAPIDVSSPVSAKRERSILTIVKSDVNENSGNGDGGSLFGTVRRKNSDAALLSETPSQSSPTTSSFLSLTSSIAKTLSRSITKKEKTISVCDKIYDSNSNDNNSNDDSHSDKNSRIHNSNSSHNNNNISDNDEVFDKIHESYRHDSIKENFLDDDDDDVQPSGLDDSFSSDEGTPQKLGKMHHIVEELLTTEEEYIKKLEYCIEYYQKYIVDDRDLPVPLRGQQTLVFSDMEQILDFHKNLFHPALAACQYDLDKIINVIRKFLKSEHFYSYVVYAMNKPKSERVVKVNQKFFIERQNELGDRLGLNSLLMEPIQRLPKYRLLIYEMIKDFMKHYLNNETKSTMESLCRAEKELQRVLDAANESITLNDIEISSYQINIHYQGKFIKSGNFEINDSKSHKKFQGKLFFFTYSLIYAEYSTINKKKLIYRGYYDCKTFGIRQDCNDTLNEKKFYLFDKTPGHNELEFVQGENDQENWFRILQPKMFDGIIEGKTKNRGEPNSAVIRNQTFRFMRASQDSTNSYAGCQAINSYVFERISNASTLSSGIGSNRSSRCSTTSTHDTEDTVFEKIINSEKYYAYYLKKCAELYLEPIEDDAVLQKLNKFRRNFEQIFSYHQNILYPKFLEYEMSYANLISIFELYFESNIMEAYLNYAIVAANACDILKSIYTDSFSKSAILPIEEFVKLPIYRNKYYLSTIDTYIKEIMKNDYRDAVIFEHAAYLQVNFSLLQKQIDETFKVYSIKQSTIKLFPFGICEYSDIVSLDIFGTLNHRICIMDNGIICIRFKLISDIQEEHFREIIFNHSYSIKIQLRDSAKHANKLHIDKIDQKAIAPSLTFRSAELKQKFSNLISQKMEQFAAHNN